MKTSVKRVYKRSSMLLRGILNSMTKEVPIVSLNGVVAFFFYTFVIDNSLLLSTHGVPYIYIQDSTTKYTVNIFVEYTFYSSQYRLM